MIFYCKGCRHPFSFRTMFYFGLNLILKSKTKFVNVNNILSEEQVVHFGVPQGSVLEPILFTLYMQRLGHLIWKHDLQYQWVQIFNSKHWTVCDGCQDMNECKLIATQLVKNVFIAKPSASRGIAIPIVNVNGVEIEATDKVKNLGVMFDKHLSMTEQISSTFHC